MIKDMKLQNEVKTEREVLYIESDSYKIIKTAIKEIISSNIDFDLSKDWNVTFAIKRDQETGIPELTASLKMTDLDVVGSQLSMFHPLKNVDTETGEETVMKIQNRKEKQTA